MSSSNTAPEDTLGKPLEHLLHGRTAAPPPSTAG
jgi:hypothetical protein